MSSKSSRSCARKVDLRVVTPAPDPVRDAKVGDRVRVVGSNHFPRHGLAILAEGRIVSATEKGHFGVRGPSALDGRTITQYVSPLDLEPLSAPASSDYAGPTFTNADAETGTVARLVATPDGGLIVDLDDGTEPRVVRIPPAQVPGLRAFLADEVREPFDPSPYLTPVPPGYQTVIGFRAMRGEQPEDAGAKDGLRLWRDVKDDNLNDLERDLLHRMPPVKVRAPAAIAETGFADFVWAYPAEFLAERLG